MKYLIHLACFSFLFILQVSSQDLDYSKGILDRSVVIETTGLVTAEIYPDADEVLLDDTMLIRYKADGTFLIWDDEFIKVLTEKGKRDNLTMSLHFNQAYEKLEVRLLEIIKKNGAVVPVDVARQSRVMVNNSQMGSNIYDPNNKILTVNIPGLEIGDIIRCVTYNDNFKTRVPNTWSAEFPIEGECPIKHLTVEISAPKELPLKNIVLRDEIKGTVKFHQSEKDGMLNYKWEIKDLPRMFPEPDMPDLRSVVQRLILSTITDWRSLSKWYWELCVPHLEATTPEMKRKVEELVKDAKDRKEKIQAIFTFVSQNIRYMGITTETEAPGYEPHDVKTTFENKYGVCRDKAALLAAMLKIAGFKAYPVIIMVGAKKDNEIPTPNFNHAITAVEDDDGSYILMDSTDESTKELFPAYLCNRSFLVAKPEGDILRTSQIIPAEENLMRIKTEGGIDDSGTVMAETVFEFDGINDNAYRGSFARKKPDEVKRFFESLVKAAVPGARVLELKITPESMQDTSVPLKATVKYIAENCLVEGDGKIIPPLPWFGRSIGVVNMIIGKAGLEKRKYPMETEIACGTDESFSLKFSGNSWKQISIPEFTKIDTQSITWKQGLEFTDNRLSGRNSFLMKTVELSPAQYLEMKDNLKSIEYDCRKKALFSSGTSVGGAEETYGPDVNIAMLGENAQYEIIDEHSWKLTRTVKQKILTYAGKKSNSELKFNYNPAWDRLNLEYAVVTAKDGTSRKISEKEMNIMDQPWCGSAPRYPPGKTLVANLPGVDIGSTIEFKIVSEHKDRPFFSAMEFFRTFEPLLESTVSIKNSGGTKLFFSGDVAKFTQASKDADVKTFKAVNQPPIRREDNLPPAWCFAPYIGVTTQMGWKDYAVSINKILVKASEEQPLTRESAGKIAAGIKDDIPRIRAVRDYIAKNIKHAGPAFTDIPLSNMSPADKTFSDGYGNSADVAVVIYSMLGTLGYSPEFVLASDLPCLGQVINEISLFPKPGFFNSVLVRVKLGREYVYLNDTNQYAELGTTRHENKFGILAATGGEMKIIPSKKTMTEVFYRIILSGNGGASIKKTLKFYGNDFTARKMMFAELTPELRSRYFQELVSSISHSAKPEGDLITTFTRYPGVEEFSVTAGKYAVRDGKVLYLNLPEMLGGIMQTASKRRENPLYVQNGLNISKEFTIIMPENYAEASILPSSDIMDFPGLSGSVIDISSSEQDIDGRKAVLVQQKIELKPFVYSRSQYDYLLKINEKISHPRMRSILVELK
ncbi:MAG TPA: hypothetical protein DET40_20180 [Lentisphaeria bacterium]|nr:MAG: hypothetical protein A2X45_16580 [Lentisphaerae bacterium GWF2_50_93]HCE45870.1 hypothetical protein [Lentisphaeria bacterium]